MSRFKSVAAFLMLPLVCGCADDGDSMTHGTGGGGGGGGGGGPENSSDAGPVVPEVPEAPVRLYGREGSFRGLEQVALTLSGHRMKAVPVPGWDFDPGASAWFTERTSEGRLVMGTMTLSSNQTNPSADTMTVGVFDPASTTFNKLSLTTIGGPQPYTTMPPPPTHTGADVSDVCVVNRGMPTERIITISAVPYLPQLVNGTFQAYDPAIYGWFPTWGSLIDNGGPGASAVTFDAAGSRSAHDLNLSSAAGALAFPLMPVVFWNYPYNWWDSVGLNECAMLSSGDVVAVQYFPQPLQFGAITSGRIVIFSPTGVVKAFLALPNYIAAAGKQIQGLLASGQLSPIPDGTKLLMLPREVQADPGAPVADQRFIVLFDGYTHDASNSNASLPSAMQEFSYDGASTIGTTSALLLTTAPSIVDRAFSKAVYGPDRTLFVAQSRFGAQYYGFFSSDLVVFRPGTLAQVPPIAPAVGQPHGDFGEVVVPDAVVAAARWSESFGAAAPGKSAWSLVYDENLDVIVSVDLRGAVRAFHWDRLSQSVDSVYCDVDVGGNELASVLSLEIHRAGAHQGVVDPHTHVLYTPFQVFDGQGKVDQFLYGVSLAQVLTPARVRSSDSSTCGPSL